MDQNKSLGNGRDLYCDSLKFILIFLVVLGHTLEINIPDGSVNRAIYNTIYLFHMPLFVFVSGRFSHIKDRDKYKKGILRLIETYVIFQIVYSLKLPLLKGEELLWKYLIVPYWIMWYLMCLVWWRLLIYFTPPKILKTKRNILLIASILICVLGGFIPIGHPFEVQRTLVFLPFFLIGYYSTEYDVRSVLERIPVWSTIVFFMVAFVIFYFFLNSNLSWLLSAGQHYWENDPTSWVRIASRMVYLPCAFIGTVMAMRLSPTVNIFSKWGCETMFIFIFHPIILELFKYFARNGQLDIRQPLLYIYSILVIVVLLILTKLTFVKALLNPISNYKVRKA